MQSQTPKSLAMRNPDARHLDFSALVGLIPANPKLLPSNLDMVYERHGYFLIAEWKRSSERLSKGQEILLRALAKTKGFTVLLITGDTDDGMSILEIDQMTPAGPIVPKGKTVGDLKNLIVTWFDWVERKKSISPVEKQ